MIAQERHDGGIGPKASLEHRHHAQDLAKPVDHPFGIQAAVSHRRTAGIHARPRAQRILHIGTELAAQRWHRALARRIIANKQLDACAQGVQFDIDVHC